MGGFNTGSAYSFDLSTLQPTSASSEQAVLRVGMDIAPNPTTNAANISSYFAYSIVYSSDLV